MAHLWAAIGWKDAGKVKVPADQVVAAGAAEIPTGAIADGDEQPPKVAVGMDASRSRVHAPYRRVACRPAAQSSRLFGEILGLGKWCPGKDSNLHGR
jgi:hypothetical protein